MKSLTFALLRAIDLGACGAGVKLELMQCCASKKRTLAEDSELYPTGATSFLEVEDGQRQHLRAKRLRAVRPPSPTSHFDASLAHAASSDEADFTTPDEADLSVLGCLAPPAEPESHRFLLQLARVWQDFAAQAQRFGAPSNTPVIICPAACVGTPFWLAFAELNALFARHFR